MAIKATVTATLALLTLSTAASAGQYAGVTTATFDGGHGVFAYSHACNADIPGTRM